MNGDDKPELSSGRAKRENGMGMGLALFAFLTFSTSDLCAKLLNGRIPPYEVAFFGGLLGILLIPFLWKKEYSLRSMIPSGKVAWALWFVRAFSVFAATALSVTAFMKLPMSEAQALMFLMPLVTSILTVTVLRQRVPFSSWVVALVGFVGILVVVNIDPRAISLGFGEICAIGVAVAAGVNIMAARGLNGKANDLSIYTAVLVGPIVGDGVIFGNTFILPESLKIWIFLFGYGLLAAFAQLLLIYASQKIMAAKITLAQYSQLIWTTVFGIVIFKDMPQLHTYIGLGIIFLSGVLGAILQKKELEKSNPPILVDPEAEVL